MLSQKLLFAFLALGVTASQAEAKNFIAKPAYQADEATYGSGFRMTITKKSVRIVDLNKEAPIKTWTAKLDTSYKPRIARYAGLTRFAGRRQVRMFESMSSALLFNPKKLSGRIYLREQDGQGGGTETYKIVKK